MKRVLALILATSLLLTILVGCQTKETSSEDDNVTISFVHWRGEDKEAFDEIISKFNEKYPHINVEQTIYPSEQYQSTAHTVLADGESGDVFTSFPGAQYLTIRKADLFEDITDMSFVDNFNEALITSGKEGDTQYAVAFQLVYNQPVYNKAIFEEAGVDFETAMKDWDSWLEACAAIKAVGYTPIAFPGGDIGAGQFMNSMMMNLAPDENIWADVLAGNAKITEDWWVQTLDRFKELNDLGYFNEGASATTHDNAINLLANEETAMLASGSYAIASALTKNSELELGIISPNTASEADKVWDGIHNATFLLGINKNSSKKEEAELFIDFLTEKENASLYANMTGQQLTLKDVEYTSKELMEIGEVWGGRTTRTQPRFFITDADVQSAVLATIMNVIGGADPVDAAADGQKLIDEILSR